MRYQAMPVGKKPSWPLEGASSRTGPAMDQSWGRVTVLPLGVVEGGGLGFGGVGLGEAPVASVNCWMVRCADAQEGMASSVTMAAIMVLRCIGTGVPLSPVFLMQSIRNKYFKSGLRCGEVPG